MFCKYCGSEIADSSKFCDKCGKPVDIQASSQTITFSSTTPVNIPKKKHKKIIFAILGILLTVIIVVSIPLIKINYSGITRGYSASTTMSQIKAMEKFHFDTSIQPCNIEYMPIQEKEWNDEKGIFEYNILSYDSKHITRLCYNNAHLYNTKAIGMVLNNTNMEFYNLDSICYFLTESEYNKLISKHHEFSSEDSPLKTADYQVSIKYVDSLNEYSQTYNLDTQDQPGYTILLEFYN